MARFARPKPRTKLLICICPIRYKYTVINTAPFRAAMSAQLPVTISELTLLSHDSYIDTSRLVTLTEAETQFEVDADPSCLRGTLSSTLRQRIKALVLHHGIMSKGSTNLIGKNLWPTATPTPPLSHLTIRRATKQERFVSRRSPWPGHGDCGRSGPSRRGARCYITPLSSRRWTKREWRDAR